MHEYDRVSPAGFLDIEPGALCIDMRHFELPFSLLTGDAGLPPIRI
jgi:hypothetical protein